MGKDWYWSRSYRKANGSAEKEKHHHQHHQIVGCMSGMLRLFDLHQLLFSTRNAVADPDPVPSTPASKFPDHPYWKEEAQKGVEAPRNSLELDVTMAATPSPAASPFDGYEIPIGIEVVPKRKSYSLKEQMEEERSLQGLSSAGRSNGNVVAKLMGLDSLPNDQRFPSLSPRTFLYGEESFPFPPVIGYRKQQWQSNKNKKQQKVEGSSLRGSRTPPPRHPLQPRSSNVMVEDDARRGTRSLPETPRMSLARRSWDSDPRLSVQSNCSSGNHHGNNKENMFCGVANNMSASAMQELRCVFEDHSSVSPSPPLFPTTKTKSRMNGSRQRNSIAEENRSGSSRHAKEIVRQMKDTVSRRIERGRWTGTTERTTSTTTRGTPTPSSSSSTPRLSEMVEQRIHGRVNVKAPEPPKQASMKPKVTTMPKPEISSPAAPTPPAKCKRLNCDRFNERLKKPPCASPANSSANAISVSSVLPQRKSKMINRSPSPSQPSPLKTDIQSVKSLYPNKGREVRDKNKLLPVPEELQYVKRVLERAGIHSRTSLPFAMRWNSPFRPLDPIIFHELELSHTIHDGPLRHRCNRKLLFDLVDEILGDLLYPYLSDKTWWGKRTLGAAKPTKMLDGESVLRQLWSTIRSFPAADCQVMQDIDALVESDIPASNVRRLLRHPAVQEEAETIAVVVERWLVDALLAENASCSYTWLVDGTCRAGSDGAERATCRN